MIRDAAIWTRRPEAESILAWCKAAAEFMPAAAAKLASLIHHDATIGQVHDALAGCLAEVERLRQEIKLLRL